MSIIINCNFSLIIMSKKKGAKDPNAQANEEKVLYLTNKSKAIDYQVIWEQERADRSKTQINLLRQKTVKLDEQFRNQSIKLHKIADDMDKQYKETEQQLKAKVTKKKQQLALKQQDIEKSKETLEQIKKQYRQKEDQKDGEITDLKNKMADLSIQFSKMLRETLQKMQERIELQQWDNESDPQLVKKMKDLSDIYN